MGPVRRIDLGAFPNDFSGFAAGQLITGVVTGQQDVHPYPQRINIGAFVAGGSAGLFGRSIADRSGNLGIPGPGVNFPGSVEIRQNHPAVRSYRKVLRFAQPKIPQNPRLPLKGMSAQLTEGELWE